LFAIIFPLPQPGSQKEFRHRPESLVGENRQKIKNGLAGGFSLAIVSTSDFNVENSQ
jgi:hypothetical protein